ncbi:MAG TPA: hypothetical protein VFQ00_00730 [Terriglobales bacterium]|nr:hypothetical protein [Terriglobales bacterium]
MRSFSLSDSAIDQVGGIPIAGVQQYNIYESTTSGAEKLLATVAADGMLVSGANLVCYNDAERCGRWRDSSDRR